MPFIRRTNQILALPTFVGAALLLISCGVSQPLCPAYIDNYVPAGTYDYNQPYECGLWYEDRYGFWWVSDSKLDALDVWAEISARPMYFDMDQEFRFSVSAADGFEYSFWSMWMGPDTYDYYITAARPRSDWNKVPI